MTCDVYKGSDFTLAGQFNSGDYRAVPGVPDTLRLKFSRLSMNRNPMRQLDPTINNQVLNEKSDEVDETPDGSLTSIACLNDALFWLQAIFGAPTTTGLGPYIHTFTLTNDCKPDFLLELLGSRPGGATPRIYRHLGVMVRDWSWDIMGDDQNFVFNLLAANQVRPLPTTAFDATPRGPWAKARAQAAKGDIYDVDGASTLGKISGATLNVALNPQGIKLGDGLTGYGAVLPGQVVLSGQITALFTDSALADFAEQHTSKTLVIETAAKSGETLKVTMPSAEFGEPSMDVETKQGIVRTYPWTAHWKTGDAAVTAVLTNNLASVTATG